MFRPDFCKTENMNTSCRVKVLPVQIPDIEYTITDFGAVGNGFVSNTKAIKNAICKAHEQGGGRVVITPGIWLTGPIELKSNVALEVKKGALVIFDKNPEEYKIILTDYEGQPRLRTLSPVYARNASNIAIMGEGVLDGSGHLWRPVKDWKVTKKQWEEMLEKSPYTIKEKEGEVWLPAKTIMEGSRIKEPDVISDDADIDGAIREASRYYDYYRPVMVSLIGCDRVLVENVTMQNSPAWNLHPLFCTNLTIRGATIRNPYYAQNGDGMDIESCQRVHIHDVRLDVGDDAICIKSGKDFVARRTDFPARDIHIHDCMVYSGHGGFVIGSEMSRGVSNVYVENCTFMGTDIGLRFKSAIPRGGRVENIYIRQIQMSDIKEQAVVFDMGYVLGYAKDNREAAGDEEINNDDIPEFCNITMEKITCHHAKCAVKINGLRQKPVHDILIKDSYFDTDTEVCREHAENIQLENVVFGKGNKAV